MTNIMKTGLPYFDLLCERLTAIESGTDAKPASPQSLASQLEKVLGKHVHLGYWADPKAAVDSRVPSLDDYIVATEAMALLHFEMAGIKDGQTILDVGCGFGGSIESINGLYQNMDLVGLNIDPRQLARARQHVAPKAKPANKIQFVQGDACELPSSFEAKFDVIMAMECIFHFPSRQEFFHQARRGLKPGGTLIVSDFVARGVTYPLLLSATLVYLKDLRDTCGQATLPTTISHYRRMAKRAGLLPEKALDITKNTLPNYEVMPHLATAFPKMEHKMKRVNGFVKRISAADMYRYQLLSFRKPN